MDLFATVETEVKKPILKKITLQNYRNIDYKVITVGEKGLILQGKNGVGKTNIIEGIYRNLSGKLFNGSSKSDTQAVTPTSNPKAKTSVKLEFDKDNFSFELISYEEYKKDGSYKGTAYDYYVNEALTNKKQALDVLYNYLGIKELTDRWAKDDKSNIDLIDLLFNVNYVKHVDYKWLRALVVDMVGDVKFTDIINDNPTKYGKLVKPLQENALNLETVKAKYRVEKFGKANALGIDTRVISMKDEITRLEAKASETYDLNEITIAKNKLAEIDSAIIDLRVKSQKGTSELTSDIDLQIAKLERDILTEQHNIQVDYKKVMDDLKNPKLEADIKEKNNTLQELKNKRLAINEAINREESNRNNKMFILNLNNAEQQGLTKKRTELANKWKETKNPTTSETITCPHCNKPFALHESKEHKDIIIKNLAKIETEGKEVANRIVELKEGVETIKVEIEGVNQKILGHQNERSQVESNIQTLAKDIEALNEKQRQTNAFAPVLDLNGGKVLDFKNQIETLKTSKQTVLNEYSKVIDEIKAQIVTLEASKLEYTVITNKEIIIENYKKDLEAKRGEYTRLLQDQTDIDDILALIKDVEQEKYTRVENKIKDTFGENIKFELFKENVDGTVDTRVCVMLVKDVHGNFVRVENLNTGLYPIRAIEFVERVRNFYGIPQSFIFVDELSALDTEHTKQLLNSGLQIIATRPSDSSTIEEIEIK